MNPEERRRTDFVRSLERGLAVIKAFSRENPQWTISDLARKTGLTRAGVRRLLITLSDLGYVRSDGRVYSLQPAVLELGYAYLSSIGLPEAAQLYMEELVRKTGESCQMSILDGDEIVHIARVPTRRIVAVAVNVGARFPAYATAMGRVLLAGQPDDILEAYLNRANLEKLTPSTVTDKDELKVLLKSARELGYSIMSDELEPGLRSVAVPLRDSRGRVIAAMSVSTYSARETSRKDLEDVLPPLLATAESVMANIAANHISLPTWTGSSPHREH